MLSPVLLMVALLSVLTLTMESDHWTADQQEKFCTWQCLKFTLQWPGSFCLAFESSYMLPLLANIPLRPQDEWIKHGSCAACVEGMNSPSRYFQICLKLRGRFDIDRALEDAGIKPSCNRSYQYDEVKHALAPVIGDDPGGREVLVQVKIPLSQNLTLGCHHEEDQGAEPQPTQLWHTSPGHPCPENSTVFHFPINHDRPHQPCD
ncbi:unnamed protein product [Coregonus sp. 'balchen']|nr:unnamed protein product [Coregonus sp. 'balchen']